MLIMAVIFFHPRLKGCQTLSQSNLYLFCCSGVAVAVVVAKTLRTLSQICIYFTLTVQYLATESLLFFLDWCEKCKRRGVLDVSFR